MPEPDLPPTPVASTDLSAQKTDLHTSPGPHFILPPPAMNNRDSSHNNSKSHNEPTIHSSTSESSETSTSSYRPASPISPAPKPKSSSPRHKRTSSGALKPIKDDGEDFHLPPPPSRSRKIIHVQPKTQPQPPQGASTSTTSAKRKPASSSSAAGRKLARRTAHSIIERRRRSKMNEEFDTLKNLIPACEGQEMHKLAILQAGVEYLRYLEACIGELKGRGGVNNTALSEPPAFRRSSSADAESSSATTSPVLPPASTSASATTTTTTLTPSFNAIHFSPDLLRQQTQHGTASLGTTSPSPNILPQSAIHPDHELDATTALLMLTNDRRGIISENHDDDGDGEVGSGGGRKRRVGGMSVRDLLST